MDFGDLIKYLVPGLVLVLWALNQLFGKEDGAGAKRVPMASPRPGGNLPPAPRTKSRPASPETPSPKPWSSSFEPTRAPSPATSQGPQGGDGVLVIGPDGGSRPPSRRGGGGGSRRGGRGKAAERRAEPPSTALVQPMSASPLGQGSGLSLTDQAPAQANTSAPMNELAKALASPGRLREAFLLQMVLGPPKALQGRFRR